jgi:hypothetical protein
MGLGEAGISNVESAGLMSGSGDVQLLRDRGIL